jgi:hypothetical protein
MSAVHNFGIRGIFVLLLLALCIGEVQAQTSGESVLDIDERRFQRRAVEVAYWGMPTVNIWAMREAFERDADAGPNAVTYFSKPMDWRLQVTTPNNSTLYIFSFWNTKEDGPIVVEVPPTTVKPPKSDPRLKLVFSIESFTQKREVRVSQFKKAIQAIVTKTDYIRGITNQFRVWVFFL